MGLFNNMIDLKRIKKVISDTIYNDLDCVFCGDCRYDMQITDTDYCEKCPEQNNWSISRSESNAIADKIIEKVIKDIFNW